jgi:hypothetical protein
MREACISRDVHASDQRFMQSLNNTQPRDRQRLRRVKCLALLNYRNAWANFTMAVGAAFIRGRWAAQMSQGTTSEAVSMGLQCAVHREARTACSYASMISSLERVAMRTGLRFEPTKSGRLGRLKFGMMRTHPTLRSLLPTATCASAAATCSPVRSALVGTRTPLSISCAMYALDHCKSSSEICTSFTGLQRVSRTRAAAMS